MTAPANLHEVARDLGATVPPSGDCLMITPSDLIAAATRLKEPMGLDFEYLDMITAVDYPDRFEVVYRFVSLKKNETLTIKTNTNKENPVVPSVTSLWQGANYQEREVYDLFGITFTGHPDLRRMMLWDGFQGHPLRKDYHIDA